MPPLGKRREGTGRERSEPTAAAEPEPLAVKSCLLSAGSSAPLLLSRRLRSTAG